MDETRWIALSSTASIPNNPNCPVVVYPRAVRITGNDPASAFETLFEQNGWPPAWRNGVFPYPHFHTTAHEVLGVYQGHASVRLGGENGETVQIGPGDVLVIPAGVSHQKLSCDGQLGIAAAYPQGQTPDLCEPDTSCIQDFKTAVRKVPIPAADPVHGPEGPLIRTWSAAAR